MERLRKAESSSVTASTVPATSMYKVTSSIKKTEDANIVNGNNRHVETGAIKRTIAHELGLNMEEETAASRSMTLGQQRAQTQNDINQLQNKRRK